MTSYSGLIELLPLVKAMRDNKDPEKPVDYATEAFEKSRRSKGAMRSPDKELDSVSC